MWSYSGYNISICERQSSYRFSRQNPATLLDNSGHCLENRTGSRSGLKIQLSQLIRPHQSPQILILSTNFHNRTGPVSTNSAHCKENWTGSHSILHVDWFHIRQSISDLIISVNWFHISDRMSLSWPSVLRIDAWTSWGILLDCPIVPRCNYTPLNVHSAQESESE